MGKTFQYSGVFHSALTQACNERPDGLLVVWLDDPFQSQYASPKGSQNFPMVCKFNVDGDTEDYYYQIENERILAQLQRIPKKLPMLVKAGGKGEEASMTFEDKEGSPIFPGDEATPQETPPLAWQGGPQEPSGQPYYGVAEAVLLMRECLWGIAQFGDAFQGEFKRPPTPEEQHMAVSMFIEVNKRN